MYNYILIAGREYDPQMCPRLAVQICNSIKGRVKQVRMPRYKIVCHVVIMPRSGQGIQLASKCLWDDKEDNFATHEWHNSSLQAIATVYGVFFE